MAKQRPQFKHGTFASFPQTNDTVMSVQVNGAFGLKFILIVVAVFNVFVFVKYITIGSSIEIHQNSINYPTPRHLFDVELLEALKIRINKQKNSTGANHDYFGLEITENITEDVYENVPDYIPGSLDPEFSPEKTLLNTPEDIPADKFGSITYQTVPTKSYIPGAINSLEPAIAESAVTEPIITEPVITEQVITEPVIPESVITEQQQLNCPFDLPNIPNLNSITPELNLRKTHFLLNLSPFGPNNQFRGFRDTIMLAIFLNRTIVLQCVRKFQFFD